MVMNWIFINSLGDEIVGSLILQGSGAKPIRKLAARLEPLDEPMAERFAHMALTCLHQEYPNKISHVLQCDDDALPPHLLTPAFYGSYDWHSAVHGHWLLVRLVRCFPHASFSADSRLALRKSLTAENITGEVKYLSPEGRASFERPYGLAWLLRLAAELREWEDPEGKAWSGTLAPLEWLAASRLKPWIRKLHYPIRTGEHDQTAFSFGLIWDWASIVGDVEMTSTLEDAAARLYQCDRDCPLSYEPSGHDFLSPCLAEADFMRRVLGKDAFAGWLSSFMPSIPTNGGSSWLCPCVVSDRADPKLAHLDGLNLSRAWMLEGIAYSLGAADQRVPALLDSALRHRESSLPEIDGKHYEGAHWLGTFATYLTSNAGTRRLDA